MRAWAKVKHLHQRLLIEEAVVGGDFEVGLKLLVKVAGAVAVPEEGDVAKLLSFRAGKGSQAVLREILTRGARDGRRWDEVVARQLEIAIILHQPDELEVLWNAHAIKVREVLVPAAVHTGGGSKQQNSSTPAAAAKRRAAVEGE